MQVALASFVASAWLCSSLVSHRSQAPRPAIQSRMSSAEASTAAAATQPSTGAGRGSPNDFLKKVIGKHVIVRLNSGVDYHGVLSCLDGFMNIALEETQEVVEGVPRGKYGDAFIRGNNVLYITAKE